MRGQRNRLDSITQQTEQDSRKRNGEFVEERFDYR